MQHYLNTLPIKKQKREAKNGQNSKQHSYSHQLVQLLSQSQVCTTHRGDDLEKKMSGNSKTLDTTKGVKHKKLID